MNAERQWQALARIRNGYQDILFGTPDVARDVAAPLLAELDALFDDPASPRVSLLVGHDSNIGSVLAAMGIVTTGCQGSTRRRPLVACCSSSVGVTAGAVASGSAWPTSIRPPRSYAMPCR